MPTRIEHRTVDGIELKWCSKCRDYKPLDQFHRAEAKWDGLYGYCKSCNGRHVAAYKRKNQGLCLVVGRKRIPHVFVAGIKSKRCARCKNYKPLSQFHRNKAKWDGLHHYCKTCMKRICKVRYQADLELSRKRSREAYAKHIEHRRAHAREYQARKRAQKRGNVCIPYDRADVYVRDKGICQICGEPVSLKNRVLDHFVPIDKGGSDALENVRVVHRKCDSRKSHIVPTPEEIQAWERVLREAGG